MPWCFIKHIYIHENNLAPNMTNISHIDIQIRDKFRIRSQKSVV